MGKKANQTSAFTRIVVALFSSFGLFSSLSLTASAPKIAPQSRDSAMSVIQHVVFILKENRSFDHYFGLFPGANGTNKGTMSNGQVVYLGHAPDRLPHDIQHTLGGSFDRHKRRLDESI